jgi:hypothetical protein
LNQPPASEIHHLVRATGGKIGSVKISQRQAEAAD